MFKKIILLGLSVVSIYSCKMNKSVNEEKLQKLKEIYAIVGKKIEKSDAKMSQTMWDTTDVEYIKLKEEIMKNPKIKTYGESGDYVCENVKFDFFKDKYYDVAIDYSELTFVVDERDGTKVPSSYASNNLVVDKFTSLELIENAIIGKWTLDDREGNFKFSIDESKPSTIFFEFSDGKDKKFNASVELTNDKFIKVKKILNDF